MRLTVYSKVSYQQLRYIYSKTGTWKKKITKTVLADIERHWKEAVLSTTSTKTKKLTADGAAETKYILSMFPYPSGELHMGHMRVYTISDVLARYHRLNGYQVLHPIGWDAFGLPAENAAIDRKIPPKDWTESNIARMKEQLKDLRISFDWDKELNTSSSDYYRWTQLIFLRMYERGLAYSMAASVNWDPVDQTVLADEQIDIHGNSWRSGAKVTKKYLKQWYLRSTNYSQSLLDGLDSLDPDSCRGFANAQRAWIRKPTGVRINVSIQPGNETLSVFTETPELLYGVDFLQISSDHPLVSRSSESSHAAGVVEGLSMVHPFTGHKVPVVVKDETTPSSCNSVCKFGISTHYGEDKETASMYSINVKPKVLDSQSLLQNSPMFDGMTREEARTACNKYLQEQRLGGWPTSPDLRDWLISRQRCWGTPIPIVHCTSCGVVPVPEEHLPVVLPDIKEISLKSGNPLQHLDDWINTPCPRCGAAAQREADTMDTFVDSSWYFLRFTDPHNNREPFSATSASKHMPVDVYVGGAEHAILHMYYARFINHFLCDEGLTEHREPFTLQLALGTVHSDCYKVTDTGRYLHRSQVSIREDNIVEKSTGLPVTHSLEKMSKSKYNGVSPKDVLSMHGVDQTRLYMLANAAPRAVKNWTPELATKLMFSQGRSISIPKWIHILWHTVSIIRQRREKFSPGELIDTDTEPHTIDMLYMARNNSVSAVSLDLEHTFNLHDAIHSLYDNLSVIDSEAPLNTKILSPHFERCLADMLILLHPFAPHITAELWEGLRTAPRLSVAEPCHHNWDEDIFNQRWPIVDDEFELPLIIQNANDTLSESNDTATSQLDHIEPDQSEQVDSENSDTQEVTMTHTRRSLRLPAKALNSLTSGQAVALAINSHLVAVRGDNSPEEAANGCKLVVRPNCGAILTLSDDMVLLKSPKQEVSSEPTDSPQHELVS